MDVPCQTSVEPAAPEPAAPEPAAPEPAVSSPRPRPAHLAAIAAGIALALAVASAGGSAAVWGKTAGRLQSRQVSQSSPNSSAERELDRYLESQEPQKQAELLLERAVSRTDGDSGQIGTRIEARVEGWRGQLKWDSQLGNLTTVALASDDESVRRAAIEVQLAAYGLNKSDSTVDALVRKAASRDHAQKVWALWALGLLGNRGVQTDRIVQVLAANLKNSSESSARKSGVGESGIDDEDARRWAVEGLALSGSTAAIVPVLDALHNDPSPIVRERAASSLAKSGMFSHEQRLAAVRQLINYSGDPGLDPQTRAWTFQALADITEEQLPSDPAVWREWYQSTVVGRQ